MVNICTNNVHCVDCTPQHPSRTHIPTPKPTHTLIYTYVLFTQTATQMTFHNCHATEGSWDGWPSLWKSAATLIPMSLCCWVSLCQPVSCLSPWQLHFPTAGKQKNIKQCEFAMDWKEREKNQTCRVIWDVKSLSILSKRQENNIEFVLPWRIWLTLTTTCDKLVNIWPWCMQVNELRLIMHLRVLLEL